MIPLQLSPAPAKLLHRNTNSLFRMNIPVIYRHLETVRCQHSANLLRHEHRAMFATGATKRNREVALALLDIERQQET